MRSLRLILPPLLFLQAAAADLKEGNAADAPVMTPQEQLAAFRLPEGFSIELVASEEQGVAKPVTVAFDDSGRLWTMTATEYPADMNDPAHADTARKLWAEGGRDRILVIDAPLGPGPHTPRVFAEKMAMPMGLLPDSGGLLVAQGPKLLRLQDTDGDGKADRTEALLSGFGVQDTHTMAHGLTRLPGGRVLVSQGVLAFGEVAAADGARVKFDRGKFATFLLNGADFRLFAAGLNNTWGIHLDGAGRLWGQEANVFDHPVAPLEEGVHLHGWHETPFVPNPVWQPGVGAVNLGSTGLSGLAVSEDTEGGFPGPWRTTMLIANAVTGAINSLDLTRDAKGVPAAKRGPDLLTCADRRFRPVHITFGPDGCLYVTDWYNAVISHNEVPRDHPARDKTRGRIWRVRHETQTRRTAPDVAAAPGAALLAHLQSANTWERRAAWHQISARRAAALVPELWRLALDATRPLPLRVTALWALGESGTSFPESADVLFRDADENIRREAVRALGLMTPDASALRPRLARWPATETAWSVRNEIARVWRGARGTEEQDLRALLLHYRDHETKRVGGAQGETLPWGGPYEQAFLNQHIRLALDAHAKVADTLAARPGAADDLPAAAQALLRQRAFLDRFDRGTVAAADLADPALLSAALDCAGVSKPALKALADFTAIAPDPAALAARLLDHPGLEPAQLRQFGGPLALRLLARPGEAAVALGLDLAGASMSAADSPRFSDVARDLPSRFPGLRLTLVRNAIAAKLRDERLFSALAQDAGAPTRVRAGAYTVWFKSAPREKQAESEAAARAWLQSLGPDTLPDVLDELASSEVGAHYALNHLFDALLAAEPALRERLTAELAERVPQHGRLPALRARVAEHRAAVTAAAAARIRDLKPALKSARAEGGRELFDALCLTCHAAGGRGVGFAPPLDGSARRDEESALFALLDPAAAVETVFQPYQLRLRDGAVEEGFLRSREGTRVTLQFPGGATRSFSLYRAHTARFLPGQSIMPPLAAGLTDAQLADLVAYLRSR